MFMQITLEHTTKLHPRYFSKELTGQLIAQFHFEVEGSCAPRIGCIICVKQILSIGSGVIQRLEGYARHRIRYEAIVYRPIRGEVIDVKVTYITRLGIFAQAGVMACFISQYSIPLHYEFCGSAMPPCMKSKSDSSGILPNDKLRVRILGTRTNTKSIFATATLLEDFLGLLRN
ncbi:DNA-directed RNA polymerase II subunit RPB7-like [Scaptodrosophila lebanonensis]|uniref:DNA-directed RNA polymerase II subunit RPB7 n=1 Tax=Drosophila lebanonensis TaxID=7225 RepID=A0A6J2UCU5_DROLE|nr:DNA-directed RNA polymerase II subunit RPB7-like [Scaptodrosophila lebanonensis]